VVLTAAHTTPVGVSWVGIERVRARLAGAGVGSAGRRLRDGVAGGAIVGAQVAVWVGTDTARSGVGAVVVIGLVEAVVEVGDPLSEQGVDLVPRVDRDVAEALAGLAGVQTIVGSVVVALIA